MVTLEEVRRRNRIPAEVDDGEVEGCLRAALSRLTNGGVPEFQSNAQYDLILCDLAGFYYYQRGLYAEPEAEQSMRRLLNAAVLELRHAKDGTP